MAHHHGHDHHHGPAAAAYSRAFALGVVLNSAFVLIEGACGYLAGSLALLADAGHNLSDVLGLALAWGAHYLGSLPPSNRRTYGLGRSSILAALANGILLFIAVGAIVWEALRRFWEPQTVQPATIMVVAAIGVVVNTSTAVLFLRQRHHDLNARGAFLHMAADAAVSLGVVLAGGGIRLSGWLWLDPAISLVIAVVIAWSTWDLLWHAVDMAVDSVPRSIDPAAVRDYLSALPGVTQVHDLHIWSISTTETALTAHLVRPHAEPDDDWLHDLAHEIQHRFGVAHTTIQLETGNGRSACRLAPDDVV